MTSHEYTASSSAEQVKLPQEGERSVEFYSSLASQALEAGEKELADRYSRYARDVEFEDPAKKQTYIKKRIDETVAATQILTAWGEDEATRQGFVTQFGGVIDPERGVLLYSSVRSDVAEPVLEGVYQQLGVTRQRLGAVPSASGPKTIERVSEPPIVIENELAYSFQTYWGIQLTEEQTLYQGGSGLYELWGRKVS